MTSSRHSQAPALPQESYHILVVDDESMIIELLGRLLSEKGYEVSTAADGREALEFLRGHTCDLVISDVRMPRLDGMQLLKAIKDMNPRLPVVMISGYDEAAVVVDALKAGAENFLAKPLDLDILDQVVSKTLSLACIRPKGCPLPAVCQTTRMRAPSRPGCVQDLVYQISLSAVAVGFAKHDLENNIKLALAEAITNAMEHGNSWDESKLVEVEVVLDSGRMLATISDEGAGFDHGRLLNPTFNEHLLSERGRGIFLANAIMDEVIYNQAGNQVTLIKRRDQIDSECD
ncbi:MAG: response regulator [Proteobacteria bacterium]|nr:response regulator [Pseudomonadota bacterium]MBU4276618.1 response regulator [Pseudomonadota bacterium]MBU4382219.1 response regulator [Pseudomonadota bacterium]MBU4604627.1 response regulator [Pseudomonadota bacterium]MCG2765885.1 response regulator [Desulfarculaceae bacterium]